MELVEARVVPKGFSVEPFLITCPGCKIRLQITNPDFVGREFACPRCKSRLEVKEPTPQEKATQQREGIGESATGHVTGTFRLGPPKNQSQDATTAIGEFADIESVLAGGPVKPAGKWINQPQVIPVAAADETVVANSHRTSQQRWTWLVFAIVGGSLAALMVTSLVIYVLSSNQEKNHEIAKVRAQSKPDKPPEGVGAETKKQQPDAEAEAKTEPQNGGNKVTIPSQEQPLVEPVVPPEVNPKDPPIATPPDKPEGPAAPPGLEPSNVVNGANTEQRNTSISDAFKEGLKGSSLLPTPSGGALLKAQGGLLDVPDVDPTIFKPKPQLINVQEQLNEVFAQVRAEKLPLVDFLDLLSQLSGMPVSLDPAVCVRAGVDPRSEVSVIADGKNLRQIAETGLRPLGLEIVALGGGLVVTFSENSPPPPLDLGGITLARGQNADFEKFIKQTVDAQRWGEPPTGAKLSLAGNQIQYQGPVRVALGVKNLLDGVRLAVSDQTPPLPGDELLKKPIELKDARTMRLADWVRKLETLAECEILIDWVSLGGFGWNLDTMVSQAAQNEPLGDVLKKFCEPRALAFRQLTPSVIEITSFMETYAGADARVVSIKKQLDGGATPEKIQTDLAKAISPAIPNTADPRLFVQVLKSPPVIAIRGPAAVQALAEKWLKDAPPAPPTETKPTETPAPISTAGAGS